MPPYHTVRIQTSNSDLYGPYSYQVLFISGKLEVLEQSFIVCVSAAITIFFLISYYIDLKFIFPSFFLAIKPTDLGGKAEGKRQGLELQQEKKNQLTCFISCPCRSHGHSGEDRVVSVLDPRTASHQLQHTQETDSPFQQVRS